MTIKLNKDKSLKVTSAKNIFTGESNSELLQFLIHSDFFPVELNECDITLYYSNKNNYGNSKPLILSKEKYKEHYVCEALLDSKMTSESGKLKIWIEISNHDKNFTYRSNSTFIDVVQGESNVMPEISISKDRSDVNADVNILDTYKEIQSLYTKIIEERKKVSEIAQLIFDLYEELQNTDLKTNDSKIKLESG